MNAIYFCADVPTLYIYSKSDFYCPWSNLEQNVLPVRRKIVKEPTNAMHCWIFMQFAAGRQCIIAAAYQYTSLLPVNVLHCFDRWWLSFCCPKESMVLLIYTTLSGKYWCITLLPVNELLFSINELHCLIAMQYAASNQFIALIPINALHALFNAICW